LTRASPNFSNKPNCAPSDFAGMEVDPTVRNTMGLGFGTGADYQEAPEECGVSHGQRRPSLAALLVAEKKGR
jgi:hypothetical protein